MGLKKVPSKMSAAESQLRVQPTIGLYRPARKAANASIAAAAVVLPGLLEGVKVVVNGGGEKAWRF